MSNSNVMPCPDCGKPVAASFAMHTCKGVRQIDQDSMTATRKAAGCECFFSCGDDPEFACSKSGMWHQHSSEPCPVHPDAPMS